MRSKSRLIKALPYAVLSVLFLVLLYFSCKLLNQTGIYVSDGIILDSDRGDFYGEKGLWLSIFLSFLLAGFCLVGIFSFSRHSWKTQIVPLVLCVAGAAYCITIVAMCSVRLANIEKTIDPPYISNITLDELEYFDIEKQSGIVYIGRNNCATCAEVYPKLIDFSNQEQVKLLYYNTINDREFIPERMQDVLDKYGVYQVPAVIVIENGEVTQSFFDETIAEDLETYLHTN